MFSKELENLIQATLEDGVLEEYEKAALLKRAQAEGVDPTELQIYINSILQRRQRERAEAEDAKQAEIDRKKKEAVGRICPKCQRPVPPMTIRCQCGYEFVNTNRLSSVQIFNEKLNSITLTEAEEEEIKKTKLKDQDKKRVKMLVRKKIDIIETFPVPNTKEDIIEFLALSIAGAKKPLNFLQKKRYKIMLFILVCIPITNILLPICIMLSIEQPIMGIILGLILFPLVFGTVYRAFPSTIEEDLRNAWRGKFKQVILKGRSLRGDAEFTQQLDYYEKLLK